MPGGVGAGARPSAVARCAGGRAAALALAYRDAAGPVLPLPLRASHRCIFLDCRLTSLSQLGRVNRIRRLLGQCPAGPQSGSCRLDLGSCDAPPGPGVGTSAVENHPPPHCFPLTHSKRVRSDGPGRTCASHAASAPVPGEGPRQPRPAVGVAGCPDAAHPAGPPAGLRRGLPAHQAAAAAGAQDGGESPPCPGPRGRAPCGPCSLAARCLARMSYLDCSYGDGDACFGPSLGIGAWLAVAWPPLGGGRGSAPGEVRAGHRCRLVRSSMASWARPGILRGGDPGREPPLSPRSRCVWLSAACPHTARPRVTSSSEGRHGHARCAGV